MAPTQSEGQPRVQWQSVKWPDTSTYEGLVKEDKCHVRGVFRYSNGDRYEGEFEENNMSGYGVYVWGAEGSVYRGQWRNSMMDGCGVKITKQPNGSFLAEEGEFVNDEWLGNVMACTVEQARVAAAEADAAAQMARVFELGGDSSDSAAALARAQAAAAAAAAESAQPAKLRRHQRQQQQRAGGDAEPAASAAAAGEGSSKVSPAPASAAAAGGPGSTSALPARQRPQGPLGIVQDVAQGAQQAAQQGAQRAQQAAQQAAQLTQQAAGQAQRALRRFVQRRQEPPAA